MIIIRKIKKFTFFKKQTFALYIKYLFLHYEIIVLSNKSVLNIHKFDRAIQYLTNIEKPDIVYMSNKLRHPRRKNEKIL